MLHVAAATAPHPPCMQAARTCRQLLAIMPCDAHQYAYQYGAKHRFIVHVTFFGTQSAGTGTDKNRRREHDENNGLRLLRVYGVYTDAEKNR